MKTLKQFVESAQDGEQWEDNEMVISARTSAMDGKLYFYPENKQRRANYGRYTATALIHKFASHLEPDEQETTQYLDANTTMRDFVKPKAGVWGGQREGAGRPAGTFTSDKVTVIRLVKSTEQLYSRYHGDTDMAVVKDGKCVAGWVNGQTGAAVLTRDDRAWDWVGLSVEELKANGFTYKRTDTAYHGAKSGKAYQQMDDGSWERADEEGWTPVSGEVQIIEQ